MSAGTCQVCGLHFWDFSNHRCLGVGVTFKVGQTTVAHMPELVRNDNEPQKWTADEIRLIVREEVQRVLQARQ